MPPGEHLDFMIPFPANNNLAISHKSQSRSSPSMRDTTSRSVIKADYDPPAGLGFTALGLDFSTPFALREGR
jgi:hypothetical protein